jgi:hypothetical protein
LAGGRWTCCQTHYLMNLGGVDAALTSFFLGAILK